MTDRAIERANDNGVQQAAEDFHRVIELTPSAINHVYPPRRQIYWNVMQWESVYLALSLLRPDDLEFQCERGLYLSLLGDFSAALAAMPSADDSADLYRLQIYTGMLALLNGQEDRYQNICQTIARQEPRLPIWSRDRLNATASFIAARENNGLDPRLFMEFKGQLNKHKDAWYCLMAAGKCCLRAKQYEEALRLIEAVEKQLGEDTVGGEYCFWRAIAHHHVGNPEESRRWYDKGVDVLRQAIPNEPGGIVTGYWPSIWLETNVHYREATELLGLEFDETIINFGKPKPVSEANDNVQPNVN